MHSVLKSLQRPKMTASCSCGSVELKAFGWPIVSSVCYCDDCQKGSHEIQALPGASPVLGPDGGTAYSLYPKDRFECSRGSTLLKRYKLKESTATNRVVATCCNAAMFVNFDKGPFWVAVFRDRIQGDPPPLEMRISTKFKPKGATLAHDVPCYPGYPVRLMVRLLAAGAAMLLRRFA